MDVGDKALPPRSCLVGDEEKEYLAGLIERACILHDNRNNRPVVNDERILGLADRQTQQVHLVAFVQPLDGILKLDIDGGGLSQRSAPRQEDACAYEDDHRELVMICLEQSLTFA